MYDVTWNAVCCSLVRKLADRECVDGRFTAQSEEENTAQVPTESAIQTSITRSARARLPADGETPRRAGVHENQRKELQQLGGNVASYCDLCLPVDCSDTKCMLYAFVNVGNTAARSERV